MAWPWNPFQFHNFFGTPCAKVGAKQSTEIKPLNTALPLAGRAPILLLHPKSLNPPRGVNRSKCNPPRSSHRGWHLRPRRRQARPQAPLPATAPPQPHGRSRPRRLPCSAAPGRCGCTAPGTHARAPPGAAAGSLRCGWAPPRSRRCRQSPARRAAAADCRASRGG